MANETTFTLTFKTIAQLAGLDQLLNGVQNGVRRIETINAELQTMASRANTALTAIGLGLSISKLNEYSNKAIEVGKQQAIFTLAVLRSKEGSQELVEELVKLNEQLEETTGTSKGTSRSIEQLFLRAGANAEQVKQLTRGVIEFAASSAGTVQPLELASVLSRRLSGAADAADISLGRLGLKAKDINGIIKELATRGGDSAEALVRASGGMTQYEHSVEHAELAVGRLVNTVKVPFLTAFTGTLTEAKTKLDGVTKSSTEAGEAAEGWGVKFAIASAMAGHSLSNLPNIISAIYYTAKSTLAFVSELEIAATLAVINGVEKMTNKTIEALGKLAKFAAETANTLSGGLINIDPGQFDRAADAMKSKVTEAADVMRAQMSDASDDATNTFDEAIANLKKSADAMNKDGPKVLDPDFIAKVREQYKQLFNTVGNFKGVKPGSGVIDLGNEGDAAGKSKAATDALTQSKYQLAAAEQTYKTALETTKLLEESGQITHDQANARNLQAARDFIAELERTKAALPGLIAQLEAVGNTKGADEAKLEYQQLTNKILEAQSVLGNSTFFGQMRSQIRQLANEWSNVGKQVGGFLTQQFSNFASTAGNAIGQMIFRTGNWKQSILQLGQSFVSSLATMLIQWVLSRTIMSALNKAFGAADAAAAQGQAGAAAAAWAPAATAASIASYGVAAGTGLSAYLAALGAGVGATVAMAGFLRGGYTGDGPANEPAGIVHKREVVFPAPAVEFWGRDRLVNMAIGTLPSPGYQRGGSGGGTPGSGASGSAFGGGDVTIINVNDWETAVQVAMKKRKGRTIIVNTISDQKFEV